MKKINVDVLVIGCGVAGLRAACAAVRTGATVIVVSKGGSASPEIMGFDAVVESADSVEQFYQDLRACACDISSSVLSRTLAENSRYEIPFLESIGFAFDRNPDGSYNALHTLGCRYPRLVHQQAITGMVEARLMKEDCIKRGVVFHHPVAITELLKADGRVNGAAGIDMKTGELTVYAAKAVVLASGGCGAMQRISTYPKDIVGDGYAIAYRAGAELVDMEFQQFEPCTFVYPDAIQGRVIPTTLLRAGAALYNGLHEDFMHRYGLRRDNAKKGELARAMVCEVKAGRGTPHGGIYYDMTMMPRKMVVEDHSIFYDPALAAGLDIMKAPAEMIPAAHTNLGGVRIDEHGATCVPGLFAAGEVTGGVYGADRIGGCAGAETLVFGGRAGMSAAAYAQSCAVSEDIRISESAAAEQQKLNALRARSGGIPVSLIRKRIADTMTDHVGIFRDASGLKKALQDIGEVEEQLGVACADGVEELAMLYNCTNMALLARMQITASEMREESRGVFFRTDYPDRDDENWAKNILFRQEGTQMRVHVTEPV